MPETSTHTLTGNPTSSSLRRALALVTAQSVRKSTAGRPVLSTGLPAIDGKLPESGLAAGGLHDMTGAASVGFLIRLLSRLSGPVLWCVSATEGRRLYGPGLVRAGLDPARLTIAAGRTSADVLWAAEEGLKSRAMAAVVLEPGTALSLTASRRLHLAAETGDCFGFVLSPISGGKAAVPPSAALTRWCVDPQPGLSMERLPGEVSSWAVRLQRCRGAVLSAASSTAAEEGGSFGEWRVAVGTRGFLRASEGLGENAPDRLSVAA